MEDETLRQWLAEALDLAKQGEYTEARTILERLCEEAPDSTEALYYLGLACKRTHDSAGAKAAWERCLSLDPFHHPARTQLDLLPKDELSEFFASGQEGSRSAAGDFGEPPRALPASFGTRSLAFCIDSLLFNLATAPFVALFCLYLLGSTEMQGDPLDWFLVNRDQFEFGGTFVSFLVQLVFIPFFYYVSGMTPGKRLLGMRIVDYRTLAPLSGAQAVGRYLASILSSCVLYLGYAIALFNEDRRALHDYLAGTFVAISRPVPMTGAEKVMTALVLLFAVMGLGMMVIGLYFMMGGLMEVLDQYSSLGGF